MTPPTPSRAALRGLAERAQAAEDAGAAYAKRSCDFTAREYHALIAAARQADIALIAALTPAVVLEILSDGAALDSLLDDALTAMREPMTLDDARRARDLLTTVHVARKKAAVRARAAARPTSEAPHAD